MCPYFADVISEISKVPSNSDCRMRKWNNSAHKNFLAWIVESFLIVFRQSVRRNTLLFLRTK